MIPRRTPDVRAWLALVVTAAIATCAAWQCGNTPRPAPVHWTR